MGSETGDLIQRIARLEYDNRRFKLSGLALLLGTAAITLMGQAPNTPAKAVSAESFILVDVSRTVRALLFTTADGRAGLTFPDKDGRPHASLIVESTGEAGIVLNQSEAGPSAELRAERDAATLQIAASRNDDAVLRVTDKGSQLGLRDKTGQLRTLLNVDATSHALTFFDPRGKAIAQLIRPKSGGASFFLRENDEPACVAFCCAGWPNVDI